MQERNTFSGSDLNKIWIAVNANMLEMVEILHYEAVLELPQSKTYLAVDIDLGGGFQGGISTTTLTAVLQSDPAFSFAIHDESFIDEIGKFFGMQDVVIGYPEFDDLLIIKTDNDAMVRQIFSHQPTRATIQQLKNFSMHLERPTGGPATLNLIINEGILDTSRLQTLHESFISVLTALEHL